MIKTNPEKRGCFHSGHIARNLLISVPSKSTVKGSNSSVSYFIVTIDDCVGAS